MIYFLEWQEVVRWKVDARKLESQEKQTLGSKCSA